MYKKGRWCPENDAIGGEPGGQTKRPETEIHIEPALKNDYNKKKEEGVESLDNRDLLSAISGMLDEKMEKYLEEKLDQKLIQSEQRLETKLKLTLEEKLEEKLEQKLEEKLEEKLDEKLEEKLEEKLDVKLDQKLDIKLAPISADITILKEQVLSLTERMDRVEADVTDIREKQDRTSRLIENQLIPNIQLLAENYVPAARRYQEAEQKQTAMENDIKLLKIVVADHSAKFCEMAK